MRDFFSSLFPAFAVIGLFITLQVLASLLWWVSGKARSLCSKVRRNRRWRKLEKAARTNREKTRETLPLVATMIEESLRFMAEVRQGLVEKGISPDFDSSRVWPTFQNHYRQWFEQFLAKNLTMVIPPVIPPCFVTLDLHEQFWIVEIEPDGNVTMDPYLMRIFLKQRMEERMKEEKIPMSSPSIPPTEDLKIIFSPYPG